MMGRWGVSQNAGILVVLVLADIDIPGVFIDVDFVLYGDWSYLVPICGSLATELWWMPGSWVEMRLISVQSLGTLAY